jgi:hypothetical protein
MVEFDSTDQIRTGFQTFEGLVSCSGLDLLLGIGFLGLPLC